MEGDDDELKDSDCLPRLLGRCTKCPRMLYRQTLRTYMLARCGVSFRAAFISLSTSNCVTFMFIRGWCLFAEIW